LMNILHSRFKIVRKIGKFKKDNNLHPRDKKRQKEVLKIRIRQGKSKGLNPKFVEKLYNLIFKEAIAVQGRKIK